MAAAALGAGIDISKPNGRIIVDIGGGTTDIAVPLPQRGGVQNLPSRWQGTSSTRPLSGMSAPPMTCSSGKRWPNG